MKSGIVVGPAGTPIDLTKPQYSPEWLKNQVTIAGAKAAAAAGAAKPSEGENLSGGFAHRAEQAGQVYDKLMGSGFDPSSTRVATQGLLGGDSMVGQMTEGFKDQDVKSYEQAKNNFVSAVLRKESGAAISPKEYKAEERKYFPQKGDGPDVIAQKDAARAQAVANLRGASGNAYGRIKTVGPTKPAGGNGILKATTRPAPPRPKSAGNKQR